MCLWGLIDTDQALSALDYVSAMLNKSGGDGAMREFVDRLRGKIIDNIIYYLRLWQKCGLKVVFSLYFQKKKKNSIIRISIKNFNHKIYLRTQTSDIQTFSDLIIGSHNHLDKIQLNKPEIIVDAGANIGITTMIYARKFPKAHIYAIEPEASNYNILKKMPGNIPM